MLFNMEAFHAAHMSGKSREGETESTIMMPILIHPRTEDIRLLCVQQNYHN